MVNIVMLVKNRLALTKQALDTLYSNTNSNDFTLTCVDDYSNQATLSMLHDYIPIHENMRVVYQPISAGGIVGGLRNLGAEMVELAGVREDYIYFTDNDVAFFPNWLPTLIKALDYFLVVGGQRHPYHQPIESFAPYGKPYKYHSTDAVAGYSMLMKWSTWERFGPFNADAKGTGQSEDFALCMKMTQRGYRVGYVDPPVIAHCGITNTEGKKATGADEFERFEGLIYE